MQHLKIKKHHFILLLTIYGPKIDIFKMLTFFQTDPGIKPSTLPIQGRALRMGEHTAVKTYYRYPNNSSRDLKTGVGKGGTGVHRPRLETIMV